MIQPETDNSLLEGCIRQQSASQKELVRRYAATLLSVARRYARSPTDAEDILQDAYILIFRKIRLYDPNKGNLVAWMRKVVVNTALAHYRNFRFQHEKATEILPESPETSSDILSMLGYAEILELIATLPENLRTVFNLAVFDEFSHEEIATMLGIPAGTSRYWLNRARKLLQEKILNRHSHELARI